MQDIQSIGNVVGTLFSGGSGGGVKPNYHHGSLKCPRCGSLNTKFCYYNNYNLSQPRFLCKGCRRYWTNGGVLRNVPVGGGTRKTKRSKHKTDGNRKPSGERKSTNSENSTGDSYIVNANISPETTPFTQSEAAPACFDQRFEPPMMDQSSTDNNHHLFSDLPVEFISAPEISPLTQNRDEDQGLENQSWNRQRWLQATEMGSSGLDKRSENEYSRSSNGGGAAEDWGVFDQSYWLNHSDQLDNFL
ncbi:hypothetical protein R6Q59_034236 [Mikania micrantha]